MFKFSFVFTNMFKINYNNEYKYMYLLMCNMSAYANFPVGTKWVHKGIVVTLTIWLLSIFFLMKLIESQHTISTLHIKNIYIQILKIKITEKWKCSGLYFYLLLTRIWKNETAVKNIISFKRKISYAKKNCNMKTYKKISFKFDVK